MIVNRTYYNLNLYRNMRKFYLFYCLLLALIASAQNPGNLDLTFDPGSGPSIFGSPNGAIVSQTALQSTGKIIVVGFFDAFNEVSKSRLVRLNTNGSIDNTFTIGTGADGNSSIDAVLVQPDDKIIIGGVFQSYNGVSRNYIARLNSNGTLDTTFNPGAGPNDIIKNMALQSDGKILIAGDFYQYAGVNRPGFARLNTDGTLDTSFNPGVGPNGSIYKIKVLATGKILIGGSFHNYNSILRENLARINSDGSLDTSFVTPMQYSASYSGAVTDIQVQGTKILICGGFRAYSTSVTSHLARMDSNGALDTSFFTANTANDLSGNEGFDNIEVQSDGKIIVGGHFTSYGGVSRNHFARLLVDGAMDLTFNPGSGLSFSTTPFMHSLLIQPDGKIILTGYFSHYNGTPRYKIARTYGGDPAAVDAINDQGEKSGVLGGVAVTNVLANDFVAGLPATTSNVTLSVVIASSAAITLNTTTGAVSIAPGTPEGTYTLTYKICNSTGACDTAVVTVTVPRALIANDDNGTLVYQGVGGVTVQNIYANDTIGGVGVSTNPTTGNVDYSQALQVAGVTVNSQTGTVTVSSTATVGPKTVTYQLCDRNNSNNCDKATIRFTVLSDNPSANDDSYSLTTAGGLTGDITLNDTRYGLPLAANSFTLSIIDDGGLTGISLNGNKLQVPATATAYIYHVTYQLCLISNPSKCDTATVIVYINSFNPGQPSYAPIYASLYEPDGKIIIGGWFSQGVKRLNSDLSEDTTFNPGGAGANKVFAVARQTDGKLLIGGTFGLYNTVARKNIARLNTDGTPDVSFNTAITSGLGETIMIRAIVVQPDGKIIVGGIFTTVNGVPRQMIVRLNTDGTLDSTFSVPEFTYLGVIYALAIQPDGKIIVGGNFEVSGKRYVARLNSDGSMDTAFNAGNIGMTNGDSGNATVYAVVYTTDGIIVGGNFEAYNGVNRDNLLRLNSDGTLNTSFVSNGFSDNATVQTISVIDFSMILVGGDFSTYGSVNVNNVAILSTYGGIEASKNIGTGANLIVRTSCTQPDKKVVIAGDFNDYNGNARPAVTRIMPWLPGAEGRFATPAEEQTDAETTQIKIYPNPNEGVFTVDLSAFADQKFDLQVYNNLGQLVFKKILDSNDINSLDLSHLQKGIYNIVFVNNQDMTNKQVIIK